MAIKILKEDNKNKEIVLKCSDYDGEIEKLLSYIKRVASAGHTFDVVVDPGNKDYEMTFEIDGDGATHINDISVKDIVEESYDEDESSFEFLDSFYTRKEELIGDLESNGYDVLLDMGLEYLVVSPYNEDDIQYKITLGGTERTITVMSIEEIN